MQNYSRTIYVKAVNILGSLRQENIYSHFIPIFGVNIPTLEIFGMTKRRFRLKCPS